MVALRLDGPSHNVDHADLPGALFHTPPPPGRKATEGERGDAELLSPRNDNILQTPRATGSLDDSPIITSRARGRRSPSGSPFKLSGLSMPYISPGQLAFSTMQFLPVPILVLNNLKTVVLANEAMYRLLGLSVDQANSTDSASSLEELRGQTLSQVGIDMLQDGRPVWVSWDSLLDSLVADSVTDKANEVDQQEPVPVQPIAGDATPKTSKTPAPAAGRMLSDAHRQSAPTRPGASSNNSVIEVVVSPKSYKAAPKGASSADQILAKMIITIFAVEENQTYFTLSFTNTETPAAPLPFRKSVPRASVTTLEAAERKSISNSNPPSVSSSHDSNSPSVRMSPSLLSLSTSPFPPMGPPSRSSFSQTPSLFQKMTTIKDALLDNTSTPILAFWADGSAPVMNAAARELILEPSFEGNAVPEEIDLLHEWNVYDEDFTRQYEPHEFPISILLKTKTPFSGMRVGMFNHLKKKKVIFDVLGEVIKDPSTGEMIAGVITCRDVTHMAQEISTIREQDEERFKLICDTMPQMVWTTTSDGSHDFFNNRWYDYTGLTPEDSLGLGWKNPFHPDDMPVTVKKWKRCLETGDPYYTEYRCLSKHGEWRWMVGRALPLRNKQTGKIEKWFGTCTDVHESLETKAAAKGMRQQLLSVLAHAATTIFSVDRNRKVTMLEGALMWNGRRETNGMDDENNDDDLYALKYVGRDVDEVFSDLSPRMRPGEVPSLLAPIHEMFDGKRKRDMVQEHEIDGRFFRTRLIPTFGKTSRDGITSETVVDAVIGVITDVTELKERELDLKAQAKEKRQLMANEAAAKEASRLKSQFLANMSHEIRTPITGVIGMAELLQDMPLGEEQREFALNIVRSANALLTVINDILDFSKVESGRLDIEEVQFSLSIVVQDVSKMLSFAAERKNLAFYSNVSEDISNDLVVLGDPGRVRQIITNLLTNSIKFTDSGFVRFSVWKGKETQDSIEIKFIIEDTGIGIDEEVRKRLFRPFSQGDASTARKFGGTGLGLTISKNLVELMRGRISLESTQGNGTIATFWIPFTKPQTVHKSSLVEIGPLPDRLHSEMSVSCNSSDHEQKVHTPPAEKSYDPLDKSRLPRRVKSVNIPSSRLAFKQDDLPMSERAEISVLVVEDNAINQRIATKTIEKLGFKVDAAWNGKEALDYLEAAQHGEKRKPDIILMDVQMPVIDGYKCTHILRHHVPYRAYTSGVPIVAMTASAIQGDREKCTKAGMDDYLAKPVKGIILERMLIKWSKLKRNSPPTEDGDHSITDCSEQGEHCLSAGIPSFGVSDFDADTISPDGRSSPSSQARSQLHDDRVSQLTPTPLIRNGSHDAPTSPFASISNTGSHTRQLNSNELASQLRDNKLMGAAGGTDAQKAHGMSNPLFEGDSLTKENVEKLGQE